ncbi:sensor histidine kinase [Novispirillum itersonii]|uniref:histidine kinase n=1 Tax=Novispirillum itersonii TaxID=189 RepID=A0A7W9ZCH9_NOVIT|nr:PAS domain S-box protein [Novispirillum itersonii]MBB6208896.1 PAS domain S-box-containing protein [Novispirillum itersonii]
MTSDPTPETPAAASVSPGLILTLLESAGGATGAAAAFDPAGHLLEVSSRLSTLWAQSGLPSVPAGAPLSDWLAALPLTVRQTLETIGAADSVGITLRRQTAADGSCLLTVQPLSGAVDIAQTLHEARRHARTQEDRLLQAIEVMNDGFALFDDQDRLVVCNRPYRRLLKRIEAWIRPGVSFREIMQAVIDAGLIDLTGKSAETWIQARLISHRNPRGVLEVRLNDGRILAIWEARTPNGETVMILSDITLRRRAERAVAQSEVRYRQLAEVSPNLIAVTVGGFLRYINPAGLALLGRTEGSVLGYRLADFVSPDHEAEVNRLTEDGAPEARPDWDVTGAGPVQGSSWTMVPVLRPGGELAYMELAGVPFHDGTRQGVMLVGRDLTAERQAREAALQRQQRLETIMEAVVDGIVTTDDAGRIEHLNRAAEQMFGYASAEVAGRSLSDLVDGIPIGSGDWMVGAIEETMGRRATGTTFPVELSVSGVQLGGQIVYTVVVRDISERQRAERALRSSEARYALAVSGTNEAIWDWDILSDRVYFSPHARDLLGVDIAAVPRARDWPLVIHPEDRPHFRDQMIRHLRGEEPYFSCEYRLIGNLDGRERWVRHRGMALRDTVNRAWRMAGSVGDISAYHAALQDLRVAKEQAELASRAKTEFLANIGHELRTPLNAIIGFSDAIRSGVFGPVQPPQYGEYARDIMDSGRHLLDIINDILDVSRIDVGMMVLQPEAVDLAQIADSALRLISVRAVAAGVTLHSEIPSGLPSYWGEGRRLKQVLVNLLGNAVKFTPEGGSVTLRLWQEEPDGTLCLSVRDTGIGMRPEDIPVALTPFRQVDNRLARRYEGTGLGLPLSKAFVELHGGTLTLHSAPDQGTDALVRLPRRQPDP